MRDRRGVIGCTVEEPNRSINDVDIVDVGGGTRWVERQVDGELRSWRGIHPLKSLEAGVERATPATGTSRQSQSVVASIRGCCGEQLECAIGVNGQSSIPRAGIDPSSVLTIPRPVKLIQQEGRDAHVIQLARPAIVASTDSPGSVHHDQGRHAPGAGRWQSQFGGYRRRSTVSRAGQELFVGERRRGQNVELNLRGFSRSTRRAEDATHTAAEATIEASLAWKPSLEG